MRTFQSFRSHFCREQYYFCLSIPHLLMTPKVTVKSPGKEAKQKSQQGFSLTDLYIIHVYSTVYSTKLTYNLLSLEALLVHSSACSDIWFISGYGKEEPFLPAAAKNLPYTLTLALLHQFLIRKCWRVLVFHKQKTPQKEDTQLFYRMVHVFPSHTDDLYSVWLNVNT